MHDVPGVLFTIFFRWLVVTMGVFFSKVIDVEVESESCTA